jgi:hypothetical protein
VAGRVVVRVETLTEIDPNRTTRNIIADSPTGNANRVVVVGAHLDSVVPGPGINDNGSGSSTILEIAEEMAKLGIRNRQKVRFAFWGAEESGLLGSEHYVEWLSNEELQDIVANLNFDMLGSPNYVRFVYDGDGSATGTVGPPGSAQIEALSTTTSPARGSPPSRPSSTAAPTTARSSTSGSPPAACSAGPRASRPPRRRPSTAAPPANPTTPATTRPATTSPTSAPRPCRCRRQAPALQRPPSRRLTHPVRPAVGPGPGRSDPRPPRPRPLRPHRFGPTNSSSSATLPRRATNRLQRLFGRHSMPSWSQARPKIARMSADTLLKW